MAIQWRREPSSPVHKQAIAKAEELNQHLSQSIRMLRATATQSPLVEPIEPIPTPEKKLMTDTSMSFAAEIKAMMDGAKAGLAQARSDGKAKVQAAVGKFAEATTATAKVSDTMAKQIEDAAASAMSELGQISNDL